MKSAESRKRMTVQAIQRGTVLDHIPSENVLKVVQILSDITDRVTIGINFPSKSIGTKGIVKIANRELTQEEFDKIAILAPNATVNLIQNYRVRKKLNVKLPKVITGIIRCRNPRCITHHESVRTKFHPLRADGAVVICHYCERPMKREEIEIL